MNQFKKIKIEKYLRLMGKTKGCSTIYNLTGFPGAGKTTATVRFANKLKRKGSKIITLDSTNTKYDFKKQRVPVLVSMDKSVAWVGKDPDTVPAHRQRLCGTESYSRYQYNMIDRVLLSLVDSGYQSIVMDGFSTIRPSVKKAISTLKKSKRRSARFHVVHLTTPYEVSRASWFKRERQASKTCDAAKRAVKRKANLDPDVKLQEYHTKLNTIFGQADQVIEVTRNSVEEILDELL